MPISRVIIAQNIDKINKYDSMYLCDILHTQPNHMSGPRKLIPVCSHVRTHTTKWDFHVILLLRCVGNML